MAVLNYVNTGGRPKHRDTILATRPNRKPLDGPNDILTVHNVPRGLTPRWVNDEGDRIYRFQEAGYEFLTSKGVMVGDRNVDQVEEADKNGSVVFKRVGMRDGQPLYAYLMAIEEEFYEEDQKRKYNKIDKVERDLKIPQKGMYGDIQISRG